LEELMAVQEEAEKTIEEEEPKIERVRERLNSPFKMKMRDKQICHAEIAERKERIDKARKQWANCKTKMGEELRKLKMESTVEIKVQEREMAEKSRRIEACKEKIRDIEEIQKTGGYEG
jgi:DNA repair exonuclease SbcCD ATPase subunit